MKWQVTLLVIAQQTEKISGGAGLAIETGIKVNTGNEIGLMGNYKNLSEVFGSIA